jgi:hypothetical protein
VVGTISKLRHFVPLNSLLSIYNSLILPYLTYGLIAWGQACKSHLNKILILQKQVLRLIFFANRNDHSIAFFISAKILPIDFLYYKILAVMMFDVDNNSAPPNIKNLFLYTSSVHTYNTRSSKSKNFYIKNSRLNIQKNAFSRMGARLWNEIPCYLRSLPKNSFKRELNKTLLYILQSEDMFINTSMIIPKIKQLKVIPQ